MSTRVTPNLAVRLEAAGVGTACAWLAMQTARDLAEERAAGRPKVRRLDTVASYRMRDDSAGCEHCRNPPSATWHAAET